MNMHPLFSKLSVDKLPSEFLSPLISTPHYIASEACEDLQKRIRSNTEWQYHLEKPGAGKMFGVLVVKNKNQEVGYLSAFSGKLQGHWLLPGFVPPLFDQRQYEYFKLNGEKELANIKSQWQTLKDSQERLSLKHQLEAWKRQADIELAQLRELHKKRKVERRNQRELAAELNSEANKQQLARLAYESQQDKRQYQQRKTSWDNKIHGLQEPLADMERQLTALENSYQQQVAQLQAKLFSTYQLENLAGEKKMITDFFPDKEVPEGAGDCTAPKLIQYAIRHDMQPLAFAQFWWGASPLDSIRHHGQYYPACRGRCLPILPFLLKGLNVVDRPAPASHIVIDIDAPEIVYEDDDLLVVNKPSGLLSVPGLEVEDSVLTRLQSRYPDAKGPILVHRLDMFTSGLLLAAKNPVTHKALQRQFIKRIIEKRYVALLSQGESEISDTGSIELPLRVDFYDRPRQLVCFDHGKSAVTHWKVVSRSGKFLRVYFYPVTGRTHQIRMHAAHQDGLNSPIIGDRLYGAPAERLMLHAERLSFIHPASGERIVVEAPAPF